MYKPIPENANKVYLEIWSCGPECCGLAHFNVWAEVEGHPVRYGLWSSDTVCYEDLNKDETQELREETLEAGKHYGLTMVDIEEDCIWDWEGRRNI